MAKEKAPKSTDIALKNLKGFLKKASEVSDPEFISTGHFYLDLAIRGVSPDDNDFDMSKFDPNNLGGFPLSYITELSGPEGSGKSSLAYRIVGNAQKKGLECAWIDAEFSFSKTLAEINGVDLDKLAIAELVDCEVLDHMYSAEEIFERICEMCQVGYKVIVLDSVANLTTRAELDNGLDEGGVGIAALAAVLSKALKKVVNYASKFGTMVIIINQMREKPGVLFGNPETTPGGRALKHLESVRIQMKKQFGEGSEITQTDEEGSSKVIGGNRYVYILKNRFGPPIKGNVLIPVYYTYHFPGVEDMVFDQARKLKVVTKYLKEFRWGDVKVEGQKNFIAAVAEKGLFGELVAQIKTKAAEGKVILPPEVVNYKTEAQIAEEKPNGDATKVSRRRKAKDSGGEPSEPLEA